MGNHSKENHGRPGQSAAGLQVLRVQAWHVAGQTQIAASGLFVVDEVGKNRSLGALKVSYPLLALPAVGQVIYGFADELKRNWAPGGPFAGVERQGIAR